MTGTDRSRAILRAAQLYYCDNMTQAAIAERLGCTRWTVGRLLKEGLDSGLISIQIDHPQARQVLLEHALIDKYGLVDAQVVRTQPTSAETLALVARTTAEYLTGLRPRPESIALGWGRSTASMVHAVPEGWADGVQVAQASAVPVEVMDLLATGPLRSLARKSGGSVISLRAPVMVHPGQALGEVVSDPNVRIALEAAAGAEALIFSPGAMEEVSFLVKSGLMDAETLQDLRDRGAVGSVLSRFIDADGEPVSRKLDRRTVGVALSQLAKIRTTLAMAHREQKVEALKATLAAGLAKVVVVDSKVARGLLRDRPGDGAD